MGYVGYLWLECDLGLNLAKEKHKRLKIRIPGLMKNY